MFQSCTDDARDHQQTPRARERSDRGATRLTEEQRRLVERHLHVVNRVVFTVAAHFPRHVDRNELAHVGALGLVDAARRFHPDRCVPFELFAARRIRWAVLDATRHNDWAPRSVRALARRLDHAEQRLASELRRTPDLGELADEVDLTRDELVALRERVHRSVVLAFDQVVSVDIEEGGCLVDLVADPNTPEPIEAIEERELRAYLRDAVALLPERHRTVVTGYFLDGRSSAELAAHLGISESRVSQLRADALERLRVGIEAQYSQGGSPEAPDDLVGRRRHEYAQAIAASRRPLERFGRVAPVPTR